MIKEFQGSYRFLSNFFPSVITIDGWRYATVEHAFQAAKTDDLEEKRKILDAETPGKAKKLGRTVTLRDEWESVKIGTMRDLLRRKFRDDPLRSKLMETGDRELIEGNKWGDRFWGVDLDTGKGENWLGRLLMGVRGELRGD